MKKQKKVEKLLPILAEARELVLKERAAEQAELDANVKRRKDCCLACGEQLSALGITWQLSPLDANNERKLTFDLDGINVTFRAWSCGSCVNQEILIPDELQKNSPTGGASASSLEVNDFYPQRTLKSRVKQLAVACMRRPGRLEATRAQV